MKQIVYFGLFLTTLFAACGEKHAATQQKSNASADSNNRDWHTLSNADSIVMKHLSLDLNVDMGSKTISGSATWDIENSRDLPDLVLDDNGLQIDSVYTDGKRAPFTLGEKREHLGTPLMIRVGRKTKQVRIFYRTAPDAKALQWLDAAQTTGKKSPFLYTQSESIYARTWVPCPDGPGIRFTYSARITVPKGMLAVMSASGNPTQINDSGVYHFDMDIAIPAYLLALAVGDIRFMAEDRRTGVYAEPEMIERVHREFSDMGKMVETAESLYGPYRWGRYDVIVLPPGFPIGGMENPKLTFCTPTVIAGDKSLVNLIAHELAHNWSGNLVTNRTWNDIWMNEGFTVYFERRICEAMNGKSYADMLWELGYQDLEAAVADFGKNSRQTWLKQDLAKNDAEDALSDIPYEKGSLLLLLIERNVGRERWDTFLKQYFAEHAFKSITTEEFLQYLDQHLLKGDSALYHKINIPAWVYGPGIPDNAPRADNERFAKVDEARTLFLNGTTPETLATKEWTTHEWLHFLRKMPKPLSLQQMAALDKAFHFTQTTNSEIAFQWFITAVAADYQAAFPQMERFLSVTGRQKFILPLYEALSTEGKKELAISWYRKYRLNYHPLAQGKLDKMLQ
ncbi:M1 family metallopeptidase [Rurimicrobium arvi]|uniref:Aminopeptidase N n=1 Tax=Rurimicrobium arvi TaxID=2049916 RepID=A0ABP8MNZ7_9BACT